MTSTRPLASAFDQEGADRPRLVDAVRNLEPLIRSHEAAMETTREIPQEITDALYEAGVYRSWMPREVGGLEVHPGEWLEAVEEGARINGSVGWMIMLHRGDTTIPPETMRSILDQGPWITAGNLGRAAGVAVRVPGGFRVSGRWPFTSGSPEATWFFGRSVLHDENGEPMTNPRDGRPWFLVPYFPASDVTLHDTWDGLGLRATGSGDFEVSDVFVPDAYVDEAGVWERVYDRPLYRGRMFQFGHAAHSLGLARAAIDAFLELAHQSARRGSFRQARLGREQVHQIAVGKADAMVRAARALTWSTLEDVYAAAQDDSIEHIDYELRVRIHQTTAYTVSVCRDAVSMMFAQAGSPAVYRGNALERIARDMMTGAQHALVTEASLDRVGQYLISRDMEGGPEIDLEGIQYILGPHPQNEAS